MRISKEHNITSYLWYLIWRKKRHDKNSDYRTFGDLTFHYNSQTREKGKKIVPIKKKIATICNLLFCVLEAKKRLFCF